MKKQLLAIFAAFMLSITCAYAGVGIGITLSSNDIDAKASDDIDNNGTVNNTKTFADSVTAGSIFVEYTLEGSFPVTFGIDWIPMKADIDKRSISQTSLGNSSSVQSSGTNSASGTIHNHTTLYIQPGFMVSPNNMIYATLGISRADVKGKSSSMTSTDVDADRGLVGTKIGLGIKHVRDNGMFFKADYSSTDYDPVNWVTSNNTKGTADIEIEAYSLGIGKQF